MGNALPLNPGNFITRWQQSSAAERANYTLFLSELCDYLDLPRPDPSQADEDANSYVIDKAVYFQNLDGSSTTNYIDLYKRNCFVLEAKQGSNPPVKFCTTAGFRQGAPSNEARHGHSWNARLG
ncbi:type IIL restriction-modification enzyme MmeI [Acidicapsa acidisoli]|uniref:type IIL restriction-modification enzyme MmeI n=1 Tax=Acidicapsa acidisoli TaxID=1615681 RepID=UPI0021E042D7|nr:type IIL restriction-modification enzyme MmeI [Acidicapsa acidisoli]